MTLRRVAIAILLLAGAGLVVLGVQNWFERRQAEKVVLGFLKAVGGGDRQQALNYLEADRRSDAETSFGRPEAGFWTSDERASYRINELDVEGDTARASVWIEKEGFVLEPVLHLVRTNASSWKIVRIEKLNVDPRWTAMQREIARRQAEQDAEELQQALKSRSGVTVRRTRHSDDPQ